MNLLPILLVKKMRDIPRKINGAVSTRLKNLTEANVIAKADDEPR